MLPLVVSIVDQSLYGRSLTLYRPVDLLGQRCYKAIGKSENFVVCNRSRQFVWSAVYGIDTGSGAGPRSSWDHETCSSLPPFLSMVMIHRNQKPCNPC